MIYRHRRRKWTTSAPILVIVIAHKRVLVSVTPDHDSPSSNHSLIKAELCLSVWRLRDQIIRLPCSRRQNRTWIERQAIRGGTLVREVESNELISCVMSQATELDFVIIRLCGSFVSDQTWGTGLILTLAGCSGILLVSRVANARGDHHQFWY